MQSSIRQTPSPAGRSTDTGATMNETAEVAALYAGVERVLDVLCHNGEKIGDCQHGVYLFYDYAREPIYVGQTK